MLMENVLAIVGPTAVGKTSVSIACALKLQGEIISADSMQVYRGMDIGTAKIKPSEMQGVQHHLIGIVDPTDTFSAATYQKLAQKLIADISSRGHLPLLVGGTGLYIRAVLENYNFSQPSLDANLRQELRCLLKDNGTLALYKRLQKIDPLAATRIHPHDQRRVLRALEVVLQTGTSIVEWEAQERTKPPLYNQVIIGLTMDREDLYQRINRRVDLMIEQGLVEEVQQLLDQGFSKVSKQALGYKEIVSYLEGQQTLSEAVQTLKRETRRYAKRQLTWFRRDRSIHWFNLTNYDNFFDVVAKIVEIAEGNFCLTENI